MKEYVIVGNGVAGFTAASTIREWDTEGRIRIFSREPYPFYTRIRLPEFLSGGLKETDLFLRSEPWYREKGIELHLSEQVQGIDPSGRNVSTSSGVSYPYDRMLLAVGGSSFVPPIRGADKEGVFTLRTMDDAKGILRALDRARAPLVIGGGLLGLEAGNGILKRGLPVQVVEFFQRLLPRQVDEAGAALLQARMEGMGFRFVLGAKSQEILGRERVEGLLLEDGRTLDCDWILISAGVRPNLELARAAGLRIDRAIVVDDHLRTSSPSIYAAGDCVEHRGVHYGIWPASERQGEVAGINMAGGEALYEGTVPSNRLKVVGIDLVSAGEIDVDRKHPHRIQEDPVRGTYRKIVLDDGHIIGCILLGDIRGHREILRAIEGKLDVSPYVDSLASGDFDFKRL